MSKNLPNIITSLRIVFVPFLSFFLLKKMFAQAAVVLLLSGVSDILDGRLARKFALESNLGKILDPIADKLTYGMTFICLCAVGVLPLYFVLIFAAISLLQAAGALVVHKKTSVTVCSNIPGKLAGAMTFVFSFIFIVLGGNIPPSVTTLFCIIVLAVVACAFVCYFVNYFFEVKSPEERKID